MGNAKTNMEEQKYEICGFYLAKELRKNIFITVISVLNLIYLCFSQ